MTPSRLGLVYWGDRSLFITPCSVEDGQLLTQVLVVQVPI